LDDEADADRFEEGEEEPLLGLCLFPATVLLLVVVVEEEESATAGANNGPRMRILAAVRPRFCCRLP